MIHIIIFWMTLGGDKMFTLVEIDTNKPVLRTRTKKGALLLQKKLNRTKALQKTIVLSQSNIRIEPDDHEFYRIEEQ